MDAIGGVVGTGPEVASQPVPSASLSASLSNLDSFFVHSTPVVPTFPHYPPQVGLPSTDRCGRHFRLADVWASVNEWSAYGLEVPLKMPPSDVGEAPSTVVQCYVPYLSAIQIFNASRQSPLPGACRGYCSDEDSLSDLQTSDSGSDCSSSVATDSDGEDFCRVWARASKGDGKGQHAGQLHAGQPTATGASEPGEPAFQFFETASPHTREPFTDRIQSLATGPDGFPGLLTLRSCDIHPASWYSVAWYPIYRIPASGRNIRDLNACFLTFHSLATLDGGKGKLTVGRPPAPAAAAAAVYEQRLSAVKADVAGVGNADAAVLQPFAFVPYKMHGSIWNDDYRSHRVQLQMAAAAGAWARRRGVHHPDLAFFLSNLRGHGGRNKVY